MDEQQFTVVIDSKPRILDLKLRETLRYRDLIFLFVRRNFVAGYKQTLLGPAWALIKPLMTTVVFTIIFGNLARLTTSDLPGDAANIPGFLYYMIGTLTWSLFASCLTGTSGTFLNNAGILGKVYFPRLVMPVAGIFSCFVNFGIQFAMFLVFWLFYVIRGSTDIRLTPWLLLVPVMWLQLMLLGLGFGLIIASMTTKYRDLNMLVGFGMQLWQYGTPVAYGLALIPEKWQALYMINPVTPILLLMRKAFFGVGVFTPLFYALSWVWTAVVVFIGLLLFNRIEKTFMDTI